MSGRQLIRDSHSGALKRVLQAHVVEAEALHRCGATLDRCRDFETWRRALADWRRAGAVTLMHHFEPEAVEEFLHASARAPITRPERWTCELRADLDALENATDMLASLVRSLRTAPAIASDSQVPRDLSRCVRCRDAIGAHEERVDISGSVDGARRGVNGGYHRHCYEEMRSEARSRVRATAQAE
jgi:hypothetical protein